MLIIMTSFRRLITITCLLLSFVLNYCHCQQASRGLVYYPPYSDPSDENDPCKPLYDWMLAPQERYQAPKMDRGGNTCRGAVNGLSFTAPKSLSSDNENEPFEDYVVTVPNESSGGEFEEDDYDFSNQLLSFTCRDRNGRVRKSSLYFWIYQYRFRRIVKSHFYQTMMPWDTEGKMLFQPMEPRQANITCHYYDPAKGYFVRVRTWRLIFSRTQLPTVSPVISKTVESIPCDSGLAALSSSPTKEIDVIVTSNRLELAASCPIATCSSRPPTVTSRTGYLSIKYDPAIPYFCKSKPDDTASYSMCIIDPLQVDQFHYNCTPMPYGSRNLNSNKQNRPTGTVKINIQSGARFKRDDDFKPLYFKEGDQNRVLPCTVDPDTSPDISPQWQRFDLATNQYKEINEGDDADLQMVNDTSTGRHRLIIKRVKLHHEGSYRCVVAQSADLFASSLSSSSEQQEEQIITGQPIYGYYFVKVYPQPKCRLVDAATNQALNNDSSEDGTVAVNLITHRRLVVKCLTPSSATNETNGGGVEQNNVTNCQPGDPLCDPVVLLYKNGMLCSMSSSNNNNGDPNSCGGHQKIVLRSTYPFEIEVKLRKDGNAAGTTMEPALTTTVGLIGSGSGVAGELDGSNNDIRSDVPVSIASNIGGITTRTKIISNDDDEDEKEPHLLSDYDAAIREHAAIEQDAGNYVLQLVYPAPADLRIEIPLKIRAEAPPKPTTTPSTTTEPITTTDDVILPPDLQFGAVMGERNGSNTTTAAAYRPGDDRTVCVTFCLNWDCSPWFNWLLIVLSVFVLTILLATIITCCCQQRKRHREGGYDVVDLNTGKSNINYRHHQNEQNRQLIFNSGVGGGGGGTNYITKNNDDYATINNYNKRSRHQQQQNQHQPQTSMMSRPLLTPQLSDEDVNTVTDDNSNSNVTGRLSPMPQPLLIAAPRPTPPPVMSNNRYYNNQQSAVINNNNRFSRPSSSQHQDYPIVTTTSTDL